MNNTVKLLNDALVGCARLLDDFRNDVAIPEDEVIMTLRDASDALAQVPAYDAAGVTWRFAGDGCEDGNCKL